MNNLAEQRRSLVDSWDGLANKRRLGPICRYGDLIWRHGRWTMPPEIPAELLVSLTTVLRLFYCLRWPRETHPCGDRPPHEQWSEPFDPYDNPRFVSEADLKLADDALKEMDVSQEATTSGRGPLLNRPFFCAQINDSQRVAIKNTMGQNLSLIQGPPG